MTLYKNLVNKISISPEKKTKQKEYLKKGLLPIVDQGQDLIGGYTDQRDKMIQCELPVIVFGDHTRCVKYIDFPFGAGADGIKILKPNSNIKAKYLFYATQYLVLRMDDRGYARHYQYLEKEQLSVPTIAEQERIVARIEELFSQLDKSVETLQKVKEQLAVYRQAVLKDAFEGKLTEQWRRENKAINLDTILQVVSNEKEKPEKYMLVEDFTLSTLPDKWKWVFIGDITNGVEYGSSKKSDKQGEVPVIRMGNIQNGELIWDDLVYSNDVAEIKKYLLRENDVLFNRTNSPEHVGKTAIYRGNIPAIFAGYLIRINQFKCIDARYLNYYLNSHIARSYGNKVKTDGVNQSNINGKKLCSYPFPLCSVEEQQQVVCELEMRLSMFDKIDATVEQILKQAEALRQSILKQAFEGSI